MSDFIYSLFNLLYQITQLIFWRIKQQIYVCYFYYIWFIVYFCIL